MQDKKQQCPIHDFDLPCPSCEMVAIDAGVYGEPYYEPPAIVYEGTLTTRAGSCLVEADRGCHLDDPAKLFGGG